MPLFADLEPPPHGLITLRARMLRRRKRAAAFAGLVLGPAAAAAAIVAVVVQTSAPPPFDHPSLVRIADVHGVEVRIDGGARIPAISLGGDVYLVP
jgi:hypothetical protein